MNTEDLAPVTSNIKSDKTSIYPQTLGIPLIESNENSTIPFPSPMKPYFTFIDLFAGVGGFRIAMQKNGGNCVFSSEWNSSAQVTYNCNYGEKPFGDITLDETKALIPSKFDVLCAGFPCQAFSIAGYRKGFDDARGTLFFDICEIISTHRPKVVFLENVKNLQSHDNGKTFQVIYRMLSKELGYKVFYQVMNSMDYANIPQNRERIILVCFDPLQVKNYTKFKFPPKIPLDTKIRDLINTDEKKEEKYYYKETHRYYPALYEAMKSQDTIYQWRRVYVRENKSNVCPTLTANMGGGGHNVPLIKDNYGIRKLTPRECFIMQGYPEEFILPETLSDSKLYMQAGNTVTVPLIARVAKEITNVILLNNHEPNDFRL